MLGELLDAEPGEKENAGAGQKRRRGGEKGNYNPAQKTLAAAQGQVNNKTTFVALPSSMMIYSCRCPGAEQHCL